MIAINRCTIKIITVICLRDERTTLTSANESFSLNTRQVAFTSFIAYLLFLLSSVYKSRLYLEDNDV